MKQFEDGDPCFAPMLNALFAAFRGTAVMNGCEPTASGTDRKVWVTAGQVQINGTAVTVLGGTGTAVTVAPGGSFDRYDLLSVTASGQIIVTQGVTRRKCPTQPADTCLVAIIFVPAGATAILPENIYDARILTSLLVAHSLQCVGSIYCGTGDVGALHGYVDVPGAMVRKTWNSSTHVPPNSTADVLSFWVPYEYSLDIESNATFAITCHMSGWSGTGAGLTIQIVRDDWGTETVIGSASPYPGSSEVSANITTTGGFYGGDRIVIRIKTAGDTPQVSSTTVTYKAERSKNIPAYKRFPETTW